ncbi:polyhydroxyalkanoic acid system family protein [Candidatus Parcubacteria bacterium]|nr:polyhydroxyalkanoic acid system family protein [Candidatus Parcubacteria bacterium]
MQLNIPHKFTKDEAHKRVLALLAQAKTDPQFSEKVTIDEERWDGDTLHFAFTAEGQSISGTVEVKDTEFTIYAKLPFMLRMFEGRIQAAVENQVNQALQ